MLQLQRTAEGHTGAVWTKHILVWKQAALGESRRRQWQAEQQRRAVAGWEAARAPAPLCCRVNRRCPPLAEGRTKGTADSCRLPSANSVQATINKVNRKTCRLTLVISQRLVSGGSVSSLQLSGRSPPSPFPPLAALRDGPRRAACSASRGRETPCGRHRRRREPRALAACPGPQSAGSTAASSPAAGPPRPAALGLAAARRWRRRRRVRAARRCPGRLSGRPRGGGAWGRARWAAVLRGALPWRRRRRLERGGGGSLPAVAAHRSERRGGRPVVPRREQQGPSRGGRQK